MSSALIVVDMLNAYDHDDAEPLKASVEHVVTPVRKLIDSANEQGFDVPLRQRQLRRLERGPGARSWRPP